MRNSNSDFLKDVVIGAVGGLIGTVVLEGLSSWLYRWEDEQAKNREERLRAGGDPATKLANRISDEVLRLDLSEEKKQKLATGVHYGFGPMGGAMFGALAPRAPFLNAGPGRFMEPCSGC